MLTKYDDMMCHQIVSTFDRVETSAREWTERIWFSAHDTSGKSHLVAGFGYYPNRNIMDAFTCFAVEGKTQYAVRASRELRPAIDEVKVGPFSYQVVEALKKVRCALDANEHGLSYEIEFEGNMPPHEEEPQFAMSRGRVLENVVRYVQVGKPSGWIKAEGKTYQINKDEWWAERDHSWGIRRGGGVPETGVQPGEIPTGYLFSFGIMQFDKWGATYHIREDWEGRTLHFSSGVFYPYGSHKEELKLASVAHDFQFRHDIRQMKSGQLVFNAVDGSKIEVSMRPLSVCYLRAGGYFGYQGFTHGLWMSPYFIDSLKLDLTDNDAVKGVSFLDDVMCEMRCGNDIGYGIIELVIVGKYPKYGYKGY
ncbi:MAG: hypothetical protein KAT53_07195 [Dehalococcoidia bacterium]|jgi:hypothetical protein|nr:hypothetical protein [Dehalococcoidia bacterium]